MHTAVTENVLLWTQMKSWLRFSNSKASRSCTAKSLRAWLSCVKVSYPEFKIRGKRSAKIGREQIDINESHRISSDLFSLLFSLTPT
jgi:hypothetical protein